MNNYQSEKRLILDFYNELDLAKSDEIVAVLDNYIVDNYIWRRFSPFQ